MFYRYHKVQWTKILNWFRIRIIKKTPYRCTMKNKINPSRKVFIKQLAVSSAGMALPVSVTAAGINELATKKNSRDVKITILNPDPLTQISWDTLRGHFRMSFNLVPAAGNWQVIKRQYPQRTDGEYKSGGYLLKIGEENAGKQTKLIHYKLTRSDGNPLQMLDCQIECKTSYSGVYKIFTPGTMSQQNYHVDLPFHINDSRNAARNQPVVWMLQTNGLNTLTPGFIVQIPITVIDGSTYDPSNGESDKQAFFGFFEAVPGLVKVTKLVNKITIVIAFNERTATRLEGIKGSTWRAQVYDRVWQSVKETKLKVDPNGGLSINLTGPGACHSIVLTKL